MKPERNAKELPRSLRDVCFAALMLPALTGHVGATQQDVEELFAMGGFPVPGLLRIDQATGQILETHRAVLPGGYIWHGLAFDGGRFIAPAIRGGNHPSYTSWLGPSSGHQGAPLMFAGQFDNMSYDVDPTTGQVWGIGQAVFGSGATELWAVDQTTGAATSTGPLIGATAIATGIAFNQGGVCFITDAFGPRLMTLDLAAR